MTRDRTLTQARSCLFSTYRKVLMELSLRAIFMCALCIVACESRSDSKTWVSSEHAYSLRRGAVTPMAEMGSAKDGSRKGASVDFMSTVTNVSVSLRVQKTSVSSAGGSLRLFTPVITTEDLRLYVGIGPTVLGSVGPLPSDQPRKYTDIGISPLVRILYAPWDSFGAMLDAGSDLMFQRTYRDNLLPKRSSTLRSSFYLGIGLSFAAG